MLLLLAAASGTAADVNRIVLRVNDRIATLYEFEQRRATRVREIQRSNLPPERQQRLLANVSEQTMREMYEELLVLSRADQLDIRVSERRIDAAVAEARASFDFASEEEFLAALAASGMTPEDLRRQMERNLLIREVMGREVQQRIELEEEDLRRYYREHPELYTRPRRLQVREVVVPDAASADAERRMALADEARAALAAGPEGEARLAAMAASGEATGVLELGWIERGDLEASLEREIWELEAGQVSQPVPARGGLHVVQVVAVEPATLEPFSEVQQAIEARLRAQRFEEEMSRFLEELDRRSFVAADPPPEAAGFRGAVAVEPAERGVLGLGAAAGRQPPADAGAPAAEGAAPGEVGPEGSEAEEPGPDEPEPAAAEPPR